MSRTRTAILISGRGSNMAALIAAATDPSFPAEIVLVLSDNPDAEGLEKAGQVGIGSTVIERSEFANREVFETAIQQRLEEARVELVCLAGFMRVLSAEFVDAWHDRLLNIHPSILPVFRGLDAHERALAAGVRLHGCTVHFVRPEIDSGPIIAQAAVPAFGDDSVDTLAARVLEAEHQIYPMAVGLVASKRVRIDGDKVIIERASDQGSDRLIVPDIDVV